MYLKKFRLITKIKINVLMIFCCVAYKSEIRLVLFTRCVFERYTTTHVKQDK